MPTVLLALLFALAPAVGEPATVETLPDPFERALGPAALTEGTARVFALPSTLTEVSFEGGSAPAEIAGENRVLVWATPSWTGVLATAVLAESDVSRLLAAIAPLGLEVTSVTAPLSGETPRLRRLELRGFGSPVPLASAAAALRAALGAPTSERVSGTGKGTTRTAVAEVRVARLPRGDLPMGDLPVSLFAHQVRTSTLAPGGASVASATLVLAPWEIAKVAAALQDRGWTVTSTGVFPLLGDTGAVVRLDAQAHGTESELLDTISALAATLEHRMPPGPEHEHHHGG